MTRAILSITLILATMASFSQTQFHFRYGTAFHETTKKVIQTQDGNFIAVGQTDGFGSGGNAFLMKLNENGNILWIKDYTGINRDVINDVIELADSTLIMCGETNSYGAGQIDGFVMKTDKLGNVLWAKSYGDVWQNTFIKIFYSKAEGYYLKGITQLQPSFTSGSTIMRLDDLGNILWLKAVQDNTTSQYDLIHIASGGVVISASEGNNQTRSCWKFSSSGNLVWSSQFTPTPVFSGLQGSFLLENNKHEIFLNFSVANVNTVANAVDACILKLDSSGSVMSFKSYGGTYSDLSSSISNTTDGGIILSGTTNSAGNGSNDAYLMRLDSSGIVQWAKAYGTVWDESASNAIQTSDGGFILSGGTFSYGYSYDSLKVYLVKTDSFGNSSCNDISWSPIMGNQTVSVSTAGSPQNITFQVAPITWNINSRSFTKVDICIPTSVTETDVVNNWTIFPNPFSTQLSFSLADNVPTTVTLYDFLGQQVLQQTFTNSTTINTEQMQHGIYFYELRNDKGAVKNGKVVKQ